MGSCLLGTLQQVPVQEHDYHWNQVKGDLGCEEHSITHAGTSRGKNTAKYVDIANFSCEFELPVAEGAHAKMMAGKKSVHNYADVPGSEGGGGK